MFIRGGASPTNPVLSLTGNQTQLDMREVYKKASVIKTTDDCPKNVVYYPRSLGYDERFNYTLTTPIYPYGQCCKVIKSEKSRRLPVFKVVITMHSESNLKSLKLLLSDPNTSSRFRLHKFNQKGVDLKTSETEAGYRRYMIKLRKETHLEGGKNFHCKNYDRGEYEECLEEEYSRQCLDILNCTLPWVTENRDLWCEDNLQIASQKLGSFLNLVDQILYGKTDPGPCLTPCTLTSYQVEQVGVYNDANNLRGIIIAFDDEVEVETSELQISAKTFLTRVGGIIGVGKEFLWMMLCAVSVVKLLVKILETRSNQNIVNYK